MFGWMAVGGGVLGAIAVIGLAVGLIHWRGKRRVQGWADPAEGHRFAEELDEQIRRSRGF